MYEYIREEGSGDPFFYFNTDNNLTYYVAFRGMGIENYPLDNMYSLDFGEVDGNIGDSDSKISNTIMDIIISFISEDDSIVIHYLCENSDSRELSRKRLFTIWFSNCYLKNWNKYDYDFDKANYNVSFLYCSDTYESELIQTEILLTLDVYERAKIQ